MAGQILKLTFHKNTFGPKPKPVIVVLGEFGFVIVAVPETRTQSPVPTEGGIADSVLED